VASGLYHGANPGMGWPLAVSAGLMERSSRALFAALWPLALGHLLAMLVVMLPFAFLAALVEWQRQIRIGASLLVIAFGIFRLVNPRHPRALARIPPTQLGIWSFAVAIAHGARQTVWLGFSRLSLAPMRVRASRPPHDTAFAQHALLRTMRATTTWFCDAYASWQKGGVENANGRLRRWLPRQIDIDKVSDQEIQDIVITANLTPSITVVIFV
jgi:hypothetical protein